MSESIIHIAYKKKKCIIEHTPNTNLPTNCILSMIIN